MFSPVKIVEISMKKKGLQGSLYNVGNKIRELVYLFSRDDLMSKDFKLHYLF